MQQPDWFTDAVTLPRLDHYLTVANAEIHYQTWPGEKQQGLLFVHGHAAHSHWWDFIAPAFSDRYQVGAIDLSGNGDSDHRAQYGVQLFANEIIAVANQLNRSSTHKPILVAHSFGGSMSRVAAHLFGDQLGGLILIDSMISTSIGNRQPPIMPRQKDRLYESLDAGKKRFRLRPPQPRPADYVLDYIASHSLREEAGRFRFKVDPAVFAKMNSDENLQLPDAATMVKQLSIPSGFVYGELSRFFPPGSDEFLSTLFEPERIRMIKNTYHHVFLDSPIEFIRSLDQVLSNIA